MSDSNLSNLVKLAHINSAKIRGSSIYINPSLLEVVAQASGFNWKLKIIIEDIPDPLPEYLTYTIVEIKDGPGWPSNAGVGPVVPPTSLNEPVYQTGTKGIAVVGSNEAINLDVQPPGR